MVKNTVTGVTPRNGAFPPPSSIGRACPYSHPEATAGVRFLALNISRSATLPAAMKEHAGKQR